MELHLPYILAFLTFLVAYSQAELSPELYWKSTLPNTPMPKAVRDLLQSEFTEDKSTSVSVGKGSGVNVNTGKPGGSGTHVSVGKGSGVNVNTGKPGRGGTHVGVGKGGVSVSTGHKGKPVYVNVSPFLYRYAASTDQLSTDPSVALFFLEKDIRPGTKMSLRFYKTSDGPNFLPRRVADSIPFSSEKLPEILTRFSVAPQSVEAEAMRKTIGECENPAVEGEERYCATSLEGMVDFSVAELGTSLEAVSTEAEDRGTRKYAVTRVSRKSPGAEKSVVCHKQSYAYAVFYCHATRTARTYAVSLEGDDGSRAEAVAVCHTDTATWNPKHLAFQVLKVKPGTVPVCHFLPEDHIVFVPKKSA